MTLDMPGADLPGAADPTITDVIPAALAAIDRAGNPAPWSAAQFQTALNSRFDTVLLAERQSRPAAFIVWQTVADESELHLIATAPESRRLGLAAALMQCWFEAAAAQSVRRLLLEVRAANLPAQNLYRRHGFTECGRRRDYYSLPDGTREDAVLMEKPC